VAATATAADLKRRGSKLYNLPARHALVDEHLILQSV
jgi:hypothetical protein